MDIIFHICLLAAIGVFFFLSRYPKGERTNLPYMFIIILCVIGLITISQSDTYICTGSNSTIQFNQTSGIATGVITTPIKEIFNYEWMITISYVGVWLLSMVLWASNYQDNERDAGR